MDVYFLESELHPDEDWRVVPEFDNYLLSSYGRIFHSVKNEFVRGRQVWNGSLRVKLYQDGRSRDAYVHILVAELYFDDYFEGAHIRHRDGDKTHNYIYNLEVVGPFREKGPWRIPDYRGGRLVRIVETNEVFPNVTNLALALETDTSTIYKCLRGERHKHLGFSFEYVD